jgi:hypothetical protein
MNLLQKSYKKVTKKLQKIQENIIKKREDVEELCKKNNVTLEEIKEVSEVLNFGEQRIIEKEEHLGTNQIISMNIRNSVKKKKKKKKREKECRTEEKRRNLYEAVRKMLGIQNLKNQKVKE